MSFNAASTHARYHNGRKLEEDYEASGILSGLFFGKEFLENSCWFLSIIDRRSSIIQCVSFFSG